MFNPFLAAKQNQASEIRQQGNALKSVINQVDRESGKSALHFAAESGHLEASTALLDLGADPNISNPSNGSTPLHSASYYGHAKVYPTQISIYQTDFSKKKGY